MEPDKKGLIVSKLMEEKKEEAEEDEGQSCEPYWPVYMPFRITQLLSNFNKFLAVSVTGSKC